MPKIDHQKPSKPNPSPSLPFNHPSPRRQEVSNTLKSRTQRSPTRPKRPNKTRPKCPSLKNLHVSKFYTVFPKHYTPPKQNFQFSHSLDKPNFSWTSLSQFSRGKKKKLVQWWTTFSRKITSYIQHSLLYLSVSLYNGGYCLIVVLSSKSMLWEKSNRAVCSYFGFEFRCVSVPYQLFLSICGRSIFGFHFTYGYSLHVRLHRLFSILCLVAEKNRVKNE